MDLEQQQLLLRADLELQRLLAVVGLVQQHQQQAALGLQRPQQVDLAALLLQGDLAVQHLLPRLEASGQHQQQEVSGVRHLLLPLEALAPLPLPEALVVQHLPLPRGDSVAVVAQAGGSGV